MSIQSEMYYLLITQQNFNWNVLTHIHLPFPNLGTGSVNLKEASEDEDKSKPRPWPGKRVNVRRFHSTRRVHLLSHEWSPDRKDLLRHSVPLKVRPEVLITEGDFTEFLGFFQEGNSKSNVIPSLSFYLGTVCLNSAPNKPRSRGPFRTTGKVHYSLSLRY